MTTIKYDLDLVESIAGIVARGEFDRSPASKQPELYAWLQDLPELSDKKLYDECRKWIYESALCGRFRGNFEDVYCRCTAVFHVADARIKAEGHAEGCRPSGIYGRAHADAMIAEGFTPSQDVRPCTCGATS